MGRFTRLLEGTLIAFGSLLVIVMIILMNAEVASRYLLGTSLRIADEYTGYMAAAVSVLCFTPALLRERFLRINSVVTVLPMRMRGAWEAVVAFVSASFCAILTLQTWNMVLESREFGTVSLYYSSTPMMYPQLVMPIGFALLTVAMLARGLRRAVGFWRGRPPAQDADTNVVE